MRLVAISDIHGNLVALEAVLRDLDTLGGWDHLWILGDLAAFGARPVECIQRVKAFVDAAEASPDKGTVRTVRGNTDRYLVTGVRPRSTPADNQDELDALRAGTNTRFRADMGVGAASLRRLRLFEETGQRVRFMGAGIRPRDRLSRHAGR
ncbi:MAG: metallophosphoesterase family protein [Anaerolineae bacterium]